MDYIREFDIRLDKEMFYAGEILEGHVLLDTIENFKLKSKFTESINQKETIIKTKAMYSIFRSNC